MDENNVYSILFRKRDGNKITVNDSVDMDFTPKPLPSVCKTSLSGLFLIKGDYINMLIIRADDKNIDKSCINSLELTNYLLDMISFSKQTSIKIKINNKSYQ